MNKKHRQTLRFVIFWVIVVTSFCLIATYLIFSALGYRINWKNYQLERTGILVISTKPQNLAVILDGKLLTNNTPFVKSYLLPGNYDLKLKDSLLQDWEQIVHISSGNVTRLENIVLLRTNPIVDSVSNQDKSQLDNFLPDTGVSVSGGEIYLESGSPTLVTRLSQPVKQVVLYPDRYHVAFQIGDEIKLCDLSGNSVQSVFKLPNDHLSTFIFLKNGNEIIIKQDSTYWHLTLSI